MNEEELMIVKLGHEVLLPKETPDPETDAVPAETDYSYIDLSIVG